MDAVRRIMQYVKATYEHGLFYEYGRDIELVGYTDADWVGYAYDRRSTNVYAFSLGGGMVSLSSKKQPTIALPITEVEYRGAALVACEISWLMKLLADLGIEVCHPIRLFCDNMSSVCSSYI